MPLQPEPAVIRTRETNVSGCCWVRTLRTQTQGREQREEMRCRLRQRLYLISPWWQTPIIQAEMDLLGQYWFAPRSSVLCYSWVVVRTASGVQTIFAAVTSGCSMSQCDVWTRKSQWLQCPGDLTRRRSQDTRVTVLCGAGLRIGFLAMSVPGVGWCWLLVTT